MSLVIGFIGFGNMASAMTKGFHQSSLDLKILACANNYAALSARAEEHLITAYEDINEMVKASDLVVVAIKPHLIAGTIGPLVDLLKDKILISVAAGWLYSDYDEIFKGKVHHLSMIPNLPVSTGQGILVCEEIHSLSDDQYLTFVRSFQALGLLEHVASNHVSIAGTLAGCGPAFAAMFIESLGDAGIKHGLSRATAYHLASQMLIGTARLQIDEDLHPAIIKDKVSSPGGTTIKGIAKLEEKGFRSAVIAAIDEIEND